MEAALTRLTAALSDRYRIERELGAGGMATVYLAHDLRHDRDVAIKVLHEDLGFALGAERFLAEIRTTARLQHPHILPLLDSGSTAQKGEGGGLLYYVMPFVTGESLRDRLTRERQLPLEDALRITREVADALGHAHGQGIVHRDIKPENVLLQGGHALVADFGIALALESAGGERLTQSGLSIGTPQYMSPEQAMGERAVDGRTDQYALAAVTYEMLTGTAPFTGATAQAVIARKLTEAPPSVCVVRPAAGPSVERAVRRALAPLPADRFSDIAGFAAALNAAAHDSAAQPVDTPPAVAASGLARGGVARRGVRVVVALAAAAGVIALVDGLWPGESAPPALLRVTIPTGALAMLGHAAAPVVAISPDGRTLAYVAGTRNVGQLMLRPLDAAAATPVPDAAQTFSPFFSPDGKWLAYVDAGDGATGARLKKRNLASGEIFDLGGSVTGMHGATWTRDGRIILGGSQENDWAIASIPEEGGQQTVIVRRDPRAPEGYLVWPALTPDGRHVVFTALTGSGAAKSLDLLDLASGERRVLHAIGATRDGGGAAAITSDGVLVFAANGTVLAAELDVRRGRLRDDPVPVVSDILMGVRGEPGIGHFALAAGGTLVYVAGNQRALSGSALLRWDDSVHATPVLTVRKPEAEGGTGLSLSTLRFVPGTDVVLFSAESGRRDPAWVRWWDANELWEARLGTDVGRQVAPPRAYNPVPSTDGAWVYTNRVADRSYTSAIFRARREEGGALERLTADEPGTLQSPYSVSPDGRLLFFVSTDTASPSIEADIFALPLEGDRTPRPVLVRPGLDLHPMLSPDGRWLAWTAGFRETAAVMVAPYPELTPERQVAMGPSSEPVWSADGRTLFYFDHQRARVVAVAVSVAGPDGLRFGAPRAVSGTSLGVFNWRNRRWDVDRAGRVHTVTAYVAEDTLVARDLAVLANWGTTLRAAVRR